LFYISLIKGQGEKMVATQTLDPLQNVDIDKTQTISKLCQDLRKAQRDIEDKQAELEKLVEKEALISSELIPNLMAEMNISMLKLSDGTMVEAVPTYKAYITKANQAKAFDWLRKNGFGDIIKNDISVSFSMGEDGKAKEVLDLLKASGTAPIQKEQVHHMTLSTFVKEQTEKGMDVPDDMFGVHISSKTKLTTKD
jgi:hypothetical protein